MSEPNAREDSIADEALFADDGHKLMLSTRQLACVLAAYREELMAPASVLAEAERLMSDAKVSCVRFTGNSVYLYHGEVVGPPVNRVTLAEAYAALIGGKT